MENENFELDQKPSSANKDLWLFLIVIDIICLCVFGFFLYKNLSKQFFVPADERAALEAVVNEEGNVTQEVVLAPEAAPAVKEIVNNIAAEPVETKEYASKPAETGKTVSVQEEPKKESVIVEVNPKSSKYRRVTFRYYGKGKKVSIVSGFTMSKPQPLRKKGDYWETTLSIAPGRYRFLYIVDGVNTPDPYSPEEEGRSVVEIK